MPGRSFILKIHKCSLTSKQLSHINPIRNKISKSGKQRKCSSCDEIRLIALSYNIYRRVRRVRRDYFDIFSQRSWRSQRLITFSTFGANAKVLSLSRRIPRPVLASRAANSNI